MKTHINKFSEITQEITNVLMVKHPLAIRYLAVMVDCYGSPLHPRRQRYGG